MNIYIVPIEPIEQRYSKQWYDNIPRLIKDAGFTGSVVTIDGLSNWTVGQDTTPGAFLNFAFTNAYKASQIQTIALMFANGAIKAGDRFLITDAWNFAVTAIRYMSQLLDIPVEIHGIWHAGSYDPSDILGMKMQGYNEWSRHQEKSWYSALDVNYFATHFHADMFRAALGVVKGDIGSKLLISGQPHTYLIPELEVACQPFREDYIMFPHRLNSDKQPEIAEDLITTFGVQFTQKNTWTKQEYYRRLGRASAVFSCALHENLGISVMEGVFAGAIPIVPNRCSYAEMYLPVFKYPKEWTASYDNYVKHKADLVAFIRDKIDNYHQYLPFIEEQKSILEEEFMTPTVMITRLTA